MNLRFQLTIQNDQWIYMDNESREPSIIKFEEITHPYLNSLKNNAFCQTPFIQRFTEEELKKPLPIPTELNWHQVHRDYVEGGQLINSSKIDETTTIANCSNVISSKLLCTTQEVDLLALAATQKIFYLGMNLFHCSNTSSYRLTPAKDSAGIGISESNLKYSGNGQFETTTNEHYTLTYIKSDNSIVAFPIEIKVNATWKLDRPNSQWKLINAETNNEVLSEPLQGRKITDEQIDTYVSTKYPEELGIIKADRKIEEEKRLRRKLTAPKVNLPTHTGGFILPAWVLNVGSIIKNAFNAFVNSFTWFGQENRHNDIPTRTQSITSSSQNQSTKTCQEVFGATEIYHATNHADIESIAYTSYFVPVAPREEIILQSPYSTNYR